MAEQERISISRDALRAELAELELRLIDKLAAKIDVDKLARRVDRLEAQAIKRDDVDYKRTVSEIEQVKESALTETDINQAIADALQHREARGWTARERWFGVALFVITVATFAIQVVKDL